MSFLLGLILGVVLKDIILKAYKHFTSKIEKEFKE